MIESLVYWTLAIWFGFYLVNHASLFATLRAAVMSALPKWAANSLQCAFCFCWWVLLVFSLFIGATPLVVLCPPCVLMFDLLFLRLKGDR